MLHVFATYLNKSMIFFGLFFFSRSPSDASMINSILTLKCSSTTHCTSIQKFELDILEQLKKGDFNSAILNRHEPIISQQATAATKLEMERKKLEKHSFVLRFQVKRHLLLNLQNVQVVFFKIVQFTVMLILKQGPPALNGSSL